MLTYLDAPSPLLQVLFPLIALGNHNTGRMLPCLYVDSTMVLLGSFDYSPYLRAGGHVVCLYQGAVEHHSHALLYLSSGES